MERGPHADMPPNWMQTRWGLRLLGVGMGAYKLGLEGIGRLPGATYPRFLSLHWRALRALAAGRLDKAADLAGELLVLAGRYRTDWNYNNALHQAHLVLGRVALAQGNVGTAREELLRAAQVQGSPQLGSFGPNMRLALDLLRAGDHETVLKYLECCRSFWAMGKERLDRWSEDVRGGREPNFAANLDY